MAALEVGLFPRGCGQAETTAEGWELRGGPAPSSMEIRLLTSWSVHGSPMLFHEPKSSHFKLCMYLTFSFFLQSESSGSSP